MSTSLQESDPRKNTRRAQAKAGMAERSSPRPKPPERLTEDPFPPSGQHRGPAIAHH